MNALIDKMQTEEVINEIAAAFLQILRDTRTPEEFKLMRERQLENGGGDTKFGCASHEFGPDPNQLMLDIVEKRGFSIIVVPKTQEEKLYDQAWTNLINTSWAIAKKAYCIA